MDAREEVLWHVLIPRTVLLRLTEALPLPPGRESTVDDVNHLDKKSGCAGSWVKDLHESRVGSNASRNLEAFVPFGHFRPCDSRGKPFFEAKLRLQKFVDAANDERDNG